MMIKTSYDSGDIVKLKRDLKDFYLKKGNSGIVWAVYQYQDANNEVFDFDYEGTFWNEEGNDSDAMFITEDVKKVLSIDKVPFTEDMKNLWLYLNQIEN